MVPKRKSPEVPDAGWSWVIAVSCCFINMMTYGMERLSGVLFVATFKKFPVSRKKASFPYSLSATIKNVSGPLVGVLGHKFGVRPVTGVGVLIASAGIAVCFAARDVLWITMFWGVIFGLGFGLGNVLLPVSINQYFDKHRATASGISLSGACLGSFLLPPLVDALLNEYGLDGTFLIISGLMLNCLPFAMLLRKPTFVIRRESSAAETDNKREAERQDSSVTRESVKETDLENSEKFQVDIAGSIISEVSEKNACFNKNSGSRTEINCSGNGILTNDSRLCEQEKGTLCKDAIINIKNPQHPTTQANDSHLPYSPVHANFYITSNNTQINVISDLNMSQNHNSIQEITYVNDAVSPVNEVENSTDLRDVQKTTSTQTAPKSTLKKSLSLLKNPMFILITISVALYGFTFLTMITAVTDFATDIGIESSKSTYVLMGFSVGDLIGRLGLGWITDRGHMTKAGFSSMCFLLQGITGAAVAWASDFWSLLATMFLYGVFESGLIVIFPLLVAQYVDGDLQTVAIPSSNVLEGPIALCVSPAIGFFREKKGSYQGVFYCVGVISLCCSFAWICVPYIEKWRNRRKRNQSVISAPCNSSFTQ